MLKKWTRGSAHVFILLFAVLCWAAPSALAQVKGSFTGLVTDPTGAVIPGATVAATNEATNVSTSRKTNAEGLYTISDLQAGFYTLRAEAQGFKALINEHVELSVGYTQRVDFKLEVGSVTQAVTVEGQAPLVDTETNRLSELITASQVQNLPLNGRNVFQMIQLAPGAVNTTGLISEAGNRGFTTVVNGARVNMNGYMLDGISDKGLSGGSNTQPSQETVQEFRVDTEAISAEYGSTVGALTTVITKTGTNQIHGDAYEFMRNDKLDSRNYFEDQRAPFHMNQFGGTIGGPIKKNKLFFFASFEGERTRAPSSVSTSIETPAWQQFVQTNMPNSVAALLYKNFPGAAPTSGITDLATYITQIGDGGCTSFDAACLQSVYGVDPTSNLGQALLANSTLPVFGSLNATASLFTLGQFYNGNQFSGRIDYQGDTNKVFGRYFFDRFADPHFSPTANGGAPQAFVAARGFVNPSKNDYPQLALGWSHTFSPTVLNDYRMGWNRNVTDIAASNAGVPEIVLDSGEVDFGGYSGYPQIFHEEVFHFADIVTVTHGKHTIKAGGDVQRNYENSEFNVGRPSYDFTDGLALALAEPYGENVGVAPGTIDPATGQSTGSAHLATNIRAWRNWEYGAFINDDWKVTPRFTLTLGLRYDLFTRHTEKYGQVTGFNLPSGTILSDRLRALNCYVDVSGSLGLDGQPCNGGFAKISGALTTGDHNNFGPRFGFAYDVRGDGKTAIRGGFGVSYNGEVYNPLSNSRWDAPLYSFNQAGCSSGVNVVGSAFPDACIFGPVNGGVPTYAGDPSNAGAGPAGATADAFAGNIQGWNPYNSNGAYLTGVVLPDFRDPYVYGAHLTLEHEFAGGFVLKTSWVGTFGHKLYRAEDINRVFGGRDSLNATGAGQAFCTGTREARINCLFGRIRTWENSVNSNYNGLQVVVDKRMSHGVEFHANYVWSHSLDTRSTWHSGATTSNGAAEGFSMDAAKPGLDYGNSIFDVTHRLGLSYVWQLPWYQGQQGFTGHLLGGWQVNGIFSIHGGFPWTPYCSASSGAKGCDFNRDAVSNDRPNAPAFGNADPFGNGNAVFERDHPSVNFDPASFYCADSTSPPAGCSAYTGTPFNGNLGRNTFRGPRFQDFDLSLFKNIKITERVNFQFRAEAFNILNHPNLQQPSATFGASTSQFGFATAAYAARQIQFALKMSF